MSDETLDIEAAPAGSIRAMFPELAAMVESVLADRRVAEAEVLRLRRCNAIGHPTVTPESLIPCQLDRGHDGNHYSTSGCAGGAVEWMTAEAEVRLLRTQRDEARDEIATLEGGRDDQERQIELLTVDVDRWHDNAMTAGAERDALQAQLEAVRELRDQWQNWPGPGRAPVPWIAFFGRLDAALAAAVPVQPAEMEEAPPNIGPWDGEARCARRRCRHPQSWHREHECDEDTCPCPGFMDPAAHGESRPAVQPVNDETDKQR